MADFKSKLLLISDLHQNHRFDLISFCMHSAYSQTAVILVLNMYRMLQSATECY